MALTDRNSGKRWSIAEINKLRQLKRENTPTRVMGIKLGRTPEAIQNKAGQIGLSLKPTNQRPNKGRRRN